MTASDSHLSALRVRLSSERDRLARSKSEPETALRKVWIAQIEKEIEAELTFHGTTDDITDDELLYQLTGRLTCPRLP